MFLSKPFLHVYTDNRRRFLENLNGDAALIFSNPHLTRSHDTEFPYRQCSDILYLSGWEDPDSVILLRPNSDEPFILFVQPKNKEREIWTGRRLGPKGAVEEYGADAAYPIDELYKRLPALLQGYETLHYRFTESAQRDKKVMKSVAAAKRMARRNHMTAPKYFVDLDDVLHQQRLIKSELEISIMIKSAEITREAHVEAMKMTAPGVNECELDAKISQVFRARGGSGPGYTSIVGGGDNAVILHYISNNAPLKDGDVVCVDAGCEYAWYTTDVTRAWPVNGVFTSAQRKLYSAVLKAQKASIAEVQEGASFEDVHLASVYSLTESLIDLGFLKGEVQERVDDLSYRKYFMHGTSHWLGIDVHDMGRREEDGQSVTLCEGMILTIEPGLYVASDDENVPKEYRGIGIRIEDDILVSSAGPINLTKDIPKEIEEIETLMATKAVS